MATNAEIAERLGVSHATVSRMRTAKRLGSPRVLQQISEEFDIPLDDVMRAAVEARAGSSKRWIGMMNTIMSSDAEPISA